MVRESVRIESTAEMAARVRGTTATASGKVLEAMIARGIREERARAADELRALMRSDPVTVDEAVAHLAGPAAWKRGVLRAIRTVVGA